MKYIGQNLFTKKGLVFLFILGFVLLDNPSMAVQKAKYATTNGIVNVKANPGGKTIGNINVTMEDGYILCSSYSGKWRKISWKNINGWVYETSLTYQVNSQNDLIDAQEEQSQETQKQKTASSKTKQKTTGSSSKGGTTRTGGGTGTTGGTGGGNSGTGTGGTTGNTGGTGTTGGSTGTTGVGTGGDTQIPTDDSNNNDFNDGNGGGGDDVETYNPYPYPLSEEMQRVEARDFFRSMINSRPKPIQKIVEIYKNFKD